MTSSLDSLLPAFLHHLRVEEQLLHDARTGLAEIYDALRRGDLAAVVAAQPGQEAAAASLRDAAAARAASTAEVARSVGLSGQFTLTALAAVLPDHWAAEVTATRQRLAAVAAEVDTFRLRNANLIGHLRSYFRGVLSSLSVDDAPVRYGPSGKLTATTGGAIQARG